MAQNNSSYEEDWTNSRKNFKMADEDEEDYMSDKFLLSTTDNNPGLVPDKIAKKYRREMKHKELNQRNKMKPMREREMEHREQGLANALDSSNKGFAMLQKMGFKKGMGLGKEGTLKSFLQEYFTHVQGIQFLGYKVCSES